MKLTLKEHHKLFPHLTEARLRSDKAVDYASQRFAEGLLMADTVQETGMTVIALSHSIPGEGKARNDMKNGQVCPRPHPLTALRR